MRDNFYVALAEAIIPGVVSTCRIHPSLGKEALPITSSPPTPPASLPRDTSVEEVVGAPSSTEEVAYELRFTVCGPADSNVFQLLGFNPYGAMQRIYAGRGYRIVGYEAWEK